ncbi:MAG: DUF294 nucleotidyltransferase-like domain-containing protein [Syntrophobacteraceae bacterium]
MPTPKIAGAWAITYPPSPNFATDMIWTRYKQFKDNWDFSQSKLTQLNAMLNEEFEKDESFAVLVAGSYGRMDAHVKSDLDFMVVHNGSMLERKKKVETVRRCAAELGIGTPNPEGAFSRPISFKAMCRNIGSKQDNLNSTAQRLLIMMEGRALYNPEFFTVIMDGLINRYLKLVKEEPGKEALALLNDLIKYFRNICINVEFNFWKDQARWGIRSIKLRHSRILIYTGLLFLILTSSKLRRDKVEFLSQNLFLSPIEKVYLAYKHNDDSNFDKVLGSYDTFLYRIMQEDVRSELQTLDYRNRFESRNYSELKTNSAFLQAEFTRFILDNRSNWTSKIFEYLIF